MPREYSDEEVKRDVQSFFLDHNHWAYQYGSPTPLCNPSAPYHKKQIDILFESKYQHWVTDRAVTSLIEEGFLREQPFQLPTIELSFVCRHDLKNIARSKKERAEIVRAYSAPNISKGTGDQAEFWCLYLFRSNSFSVVGRKTRKYRDAIWEETDNDLDFIVEKDGIAYGVEVKNWFPYVNDSLYDIKLKICAHFGVRPLFFFRMASYEQIEKAENQDGRVLVFKSKIFPPGNEELVRNIWNKMRLPVSIWTDVPIRIQRNLLAYHESLK